MTTVSHRLGEVRALFALSLRSGGCGLPGDLRWLAWPWSDGHRRWRRGLPEGPLTNVTTDRVPQPSRFEAMQV